MALLMLLFPPPKSVACYLIKTMKTLACNDYCKSNDKTSLLSKNEEN